ncbi:MAG: adenylyl-sulfate kinase [Acidobacteria bacterium]|nr:adenylyl-sulfate kinase [Acidobacteriota bacterium]
MKSVDAVATGHPIHHGPLFRPRQDDIYIASYPRSGTTWVQMILYQLTTDGEMTFRHISEVSPFWEESLKSGLGLDSLPSPRLLKTHLPYKQVSCQPGKYIYVARNGKDVLLSYFDFYKTYVGRRKSFSEFFDDFLVGHVQYGSWFRHIAAWNAQTRSPNVLFLHYEELIGAFDKSLERIVFFCGRSIPAEVRDRIAERCSFAFMKQHENKFAPQSPMPADSAEWKSEGAFIRQGKAGTWKQQLSKEQAEAFDAVAQRHSLEPLKGLVVWFTGLSSAGKTTIAKHVRERLLERGLPVELLDGDAIRQGISSDLAFTRADREENVRRIANMASRLRRNGAIVLVAAISPFRESRSEARRICGGFIEVYVHAPLQVCESRDVKGLYPRARRSEIRQFTGIDDPYEPPLKPDVECRTGEENIDASAARVLDVIQLSLETSVTVTSGSLR